MKSLIARKRQHNAFSYKVVVGRDGFRSGNIFKMTDKSKLVDDYSIYKMTIAGKVYVVKKIGKYDEDEWDNVSQIIMKKLRSPLIIHYYACIRSMASHHRYIVMELADMDLKDFIRKYNPMVDRKFIERVIKMALEFQLWCIENLNMIYTDFKTRNIFVNIRNKENPVEDFQLLFGDIGLMDPADDDYECNEEMLCDAEVVNFMYPRRPCSAHTCALFIIAMLGVELSVFHLKAYGDTDNEGEAENKDENKDENKENLAEGGEKDVQEEGEEEAESGDEETSDETSEDESGSQESESGRQIGAGFITLLDGRESDDTLVSLVNGIDFFKEESNSDIRDFIVDMIQFKYDNVKHAKHIFNKIIERK